MNVVKCLGGRDVNDERIADHCNTKYEQMEDLQECLFAKLARILFRDSVDLNDSPKLLKFEFEEEGGNPQGKHRELPDDNVATTLLFRAVVVWEPFVDHSVYANEAISNENICNPGCTPGLSRTSG